MENPNINISAEAIEIALNGARVQAAIIEGADRYEARAMLRGNSQFINDTPIIGSPFRDKSYQVAVAYVSNNDRLARKWRG